MDSAFYSIGESASYYALLCVIVLLSFWESRKPRRRLGKPIRNRWTRSFALFIIGTVAVRLVVPIVSLDTAWRALEQGWGLLNLTGAPLWINIIACILLLDFTRWALHLASHRYKLLWLMHRTHHTDQEFDFTTSLRFHPFELAAITLINIGMITIMGFHPAGVLIAEGLAISYNAFNHANVRLPSKLDSTLRHVVITPDMHRIHHSALPGEFNANFGGFFSWWDRLFDCYVAEPSDGHEGMTIGLKEYQDDASTSLLRLVADPFR